MRALKISVIAMCFAGMATGVLAAGTVTVTGSGSVASVPDMATINLAVTSEADTAAQAMAKNSAATGEVLKVLVSLGIEARDMQTSNLSLQPNWSNQKNSMNSRKIIGYVVYNQLTVRVRELAQTGDIMDAVVRAGGNTFNGLSFGLQDPLPATDEARKLAVLDAIRKAKLYADAAGITLGSIQELSEHGGVSRGPEMLQMARSAVPIAEGEVSIRASVSIVYAIAD